MGQDIQKIRKYLGISQCYISYTCGLGVNYIGQLEKGSIKNISFKNAYKIAFFFLEELNKKKIDIKELENVVGDSIIIDLIYTLKSKSTYNYNFFYS